MKTSCRSFFQSFKLVLPIVLIANSGDFILLFFDIQKEDGAIYSYIEWGIVISLAIFYEVIIFLKRKN